MPHPHETEIRTFARATPFVPFTIVTNSGARYRVPSGDHLFFPPDTDEEGAPLPLEERSQAFQLFSRGVRYHWIFFDTVAAVEDFKPPSNGDHSRE
jgi:hypothetical protein